MDESNCVARRDAAVGLLNGDGMSDQGNLLSDAFVEQLRVDHDFLASVVGSPLKRRYIPRGSGAPIVNRPYVVTEVTSPDGDNKVVIGLPLGTTFKAKRGLDDPPFTLADEEEDIYFGLSGGFVCTDQVVLVSSVNGFRQVTGGMLYHNFRGNAAEDIEDGATGNINVKYLDRNGAEQSAIGAAVNRWGRGVVAGQFVYGDLIQNVLYIFDADCDV